MATISSTMGVQDGRLCFGEASRGDIGCPSYAPSVSPTGTLNLGAGLTVNTVSLTTGGTTWGYLGNAASYIPNLASNAVSTTNISITTINGVSVSALGGGGGAGVYDSGWFSVTTSKQYTLNHGLGGIPDIVQVFWSNTADGSGNVTLIGNTTYGAANTLINRINNTSIGIFTGPTYLTYLRDPSGTYTGPSTGYHKVIAIKFNGGAGSGGGSGGTGVSAMSSLTDVTLTNPVSNSLLVYDGSKWVNKLFQDTVSTTTMMSGWPDAISCSGATGSSILYHNYSYTSGGGHDYYTTTGTAYRVTFTSTGAFSAYYQSGDYVSSCNGKSINQLYAEGRAFNFIGNNGSGTGMLGHAITSGTLSVTANSSTSIVSLTTAGTTWGYIGASGSYLPNLNSNAISATNISLSTINGLPISSFGSGSGSSMKASFPDAVLCSGSAGSIYLYISYIPTDGSVVYRGVTSTAYNLTFTSSGAYSNYSGSDYVSSCANKSINQLIADGKAFNFVGGSGRTAPDYQVFTASGTWTKPANLPAHAMVEVELWGGGGGGTNSGTGGGGGGGGTYIRLVIRAAELSSTVNVSVGAGGSAGAAGEASSFGTYATAYGGAPGGGNGGGGGGGGGPLGTGGTGQSGGTGGAGGAGGNPDVAGGGNGGGANQNGVSAFWGGGGGGGKGATKGGSSIFGGGGGGGSSTNSGGGSGGTSLFAGDGGAGHVEGSAPAGGGGRNAAGARGEVRVRAAE